MRVQNMKALTITFKNGDIKNYIFETEEEALRFYCKYKEHNKIDKIEVKHTNTLRNK